MAQLSSMAPPLSPREPRRSNRRSAHSTSTSTSKSSGSPSPESTMAPPTKDTDHSSAPNRSAASSSTNSSRSKRVKDDQDDHPDDSRHRRNVSVTSTAGTISGPPAKRTKRKSKDKASQGSTHSEANSMKPPEPIPDQANEGQDEDEDASVTRCVCGGNDPDAGEFMIQCEQCKVWQHGHCMGFPSESQAPQGDYYCEECKPEDHTELLKTVHKRQRQGSAQSHHTAQRGTSRSSRSHSPSHMLKASKRRNTMNSRDAAYEESLQGLLEATAAEAAVVDSEAKDAGDVSHVGEDQIGEVIEFGPGSRKKRKRAEDEPSVSKRKRSASTTSERPILAAVGDARVEASLGPNTFLPPPPPPPKNSRVKRGNPRRPAAVVEPPPGDGEDGGPNSKKHPNQYTYRGKPATAAQMRRAPPSYTSQTSNGVAHEHGTRRNAHPSQINSSAPGGSGSVSGSGGPSRIAYYQNTPPQQPLFTSWSLPDYLAHLQSILPTDIPAPLMIRGPGFVSEGENKVSERGVKVKWPAKRMSVADMNKRVRAMVEWVGREQAGTSERERRKVALEKALALNRATENEIGAENTLRGEPPRIVDEGGDVRMVDGDMLKESPVRDTSAVPQVVSQDANRQGSRSGSSEEMHTWTKESRQSTVKMMEGLMEELINFQERFGPGAKSRGKDRGGRAIAVS